VVAGWESGLCELVRGLRTDRGDGEFWREVRVGEWRIEGFWCGNDGFGPADGGTVNCSTWNNWKSAEMTQVSAAFAGQKYGCSGQFYGATYGDLR